METIESKEHNFEVNDTNGILLALENGHEIELSEGDGFRMVSNGDIPHIELYMDDEPFSIKIEEKTLLSRPFSNASKMPLVSFTSKLCSLLSIVSMRRLLLG